MHASVSLSSYYANNVLVLKLMVIGCYDAGRRRHQVHLQSFEEREMKAFFFQTLRQTGKSYGCLLAACGEVALSVQTSTALQALTLILI